MEPVIWGVILILAAIFTAWLGVRRRKALQARYADTAVRYTASTTMTIVKLEESSAEFWADMEDGSRERQTSTVYAPTYAYTVDGKAYQYTSRRYSSGQFIGKHVTGYYDPANPADITEDKPRRPVLGGFAFFAGAAFLLAFAVLTLAGEVYIY